MNFYESWFYRYILNASWFVWGGVGLIFILNILMPLLLWLTISGRHVRMPGRRKEAGETEETQPEG